MIESYHLVGLIIYRYETTLHQIFGEDETVERTDSQLATITVKTLSALQSNLEGKSKLYRDPALSQIFLMNNVHCVVESVKRWSSFPSLRLVWLIFSISHLLNLSDTFPGQKLGIF
jgi:hypothetical protein